MTIRLKRMSSAYDKLEDRLRITGETDQDTTVVLWFTQRLLRRLLSALLQQLEKDSPPRTPAAGARELVQSFAQEAAVAGLRRQAPVAAQDESPAWLVQSVDVTPTESHVALAFRARNGESANVRLRTTELRQWLAIMHAVWTRAQWPADFWPAWIAADEVPDSETVRH